MRSTVTVKTAPAKEPVTVAQAMKHCRVDNVAEEELVGDYLSSARIMAEGYMARALISQTLTWTIRPENSLWPRDSRLHGLLTFPRTPVTAINSVVATDTFGNVTTIPVATLPVPNGQQLLGYIPDLSLEPSLLRIGGWTPLTDGRILGSSLLQHLQVEFVAGWDDPADVPAPICNGIKLLTAFLYENRGDTPADMPKAAEWLFDRYRMSWVD